MPRICFIPGCRTHKAYYERGVAMFSYPRDAQLLLAWNKACSRDENYRPPRYACICEKHFDPAAIQGKAQGRAKLHKGAIPTRFLSGWCPDASESPITSTFIAAVDASKENSEQTFEGSIDDESPEDIKEQPEIFNVEEVFLRTKNKHLMAPEVDLLSAKMFCRMCGIKHEQDNKCNLDDLQSDELGKALLRLCLTEDRTLEPVKEVCLKCFKETESFLNFLQNCHEGQRVLIERIEENRKAQELLTEQPQRDLQSGGDNEQLTDSGEGSDSDEENNVQLSDPEENETEEMKDARYDRFIDRLVVELKSEKRISVAPRDWECLDCREIFQHRNHLAIHRKSCPLVGSEYSKRYGTFACQLCDKTFKTLPGYRYHLLKMHDRDKMRATGSTKDDSTTVDENDEHYPEELRALKARKTVICPICSDTFRTCGDLRYHLPSHKSINKQRSRELGQAVGNFDKAKTMQYMCSICGKMERSNAGLEIHMKFHLKQKDWACEMCDKQYYTKADLKQHILTIHEQLTFTCDDCGTVLSSRATFTRHRRLHNESELKACTYCPKKFTTTNALKRHVENRHLGQKRLRIHNVEILEEEMSWQTQEIDALDEMIIEEIDESEQSELNNAAMVKEEHILLTEGEFNLDEPL